MLNICRNEARYWSQSGRRGPMLSSAEIEEGIASSTCATQSGGRSERVVPTKFLQPPRREGTCAFERFCPGGCGLVAGNADKIHVRPPIPALNRIKEIFFDTFLGRTNAPWSCSFVTICQEPEPWAGTRTIASSSMPPPTLDHSGIFQRFSTKTRVRGECGTPAALFLVP